MPRIHGLPQLTISVLTVAAANISEIPNASVPVDVGVDVSSQAIYSPCLLSAYLVCLLRVCVITTTVLIVVCSLGAESNYTVLSQFIYLLKFSCKASTAPSRLCVWKVSPELEWAGVGFEDGTVYAARRAGDVVYARVVDVQNVSTHPQSYPLTVLHFPISTILSRASAKLLPATTALGLFSRA